MVTDGEALARNQSSTRRSQISDMEGMPRFSAWASVAPHAKDKGDQTIEREDSRAQYV